MVPSGKLSGNHSFGGKCSVSVKGSANQEGLSLLLYVYWTVASGGLLSGKVLIFLFYVNFLSFAYFFPYRVAHETSQTGRFFIAFSDYTMIIDKLSLF